MVNAALPTTALPDTCSKSESTRNTGFPFHELRKKRELDGDGVTGREVVGGEMASLALIWKQASNCIAAHSKLP